MRVLTGCVLLWLAGTNAQAAGPVRVCLVSGSEEYDSDESLATFKTYLESHGQLTCSLIKASAVDDLPGLEALDDCDVALFFTRRLTIEGEQLEAVKRYALSGRPIVGVRTASHGFQNWLDFDKVVYGGNYHGHYKHDVETVARPAAGRADHPILKGVGPITSLGGLYRVTPLADDTSVLLLGTAPEGTEPVAWTRTHNGGRVVYTSLGTQDDFRNPDFLQLLTNALFWAAGRESAILNSAQEAQR